MNIVDYYTELINNENCMFLYTEKEPWLIVSNTGDGIMTYTDPMFSKIKLNDVPKYMIIIADVDILSQFDYRLAYSSSLMN